MGIIRSLAVWFMIAIVTLVDAYLPTGVPGPSTRTVVDPIHRRRRKNPRARMNVDPGRSFVRPIDACSRKCPYCDQEFARGYNRLRHQMLCQGERNDVIPEAVRKMPFNRRQLFAAPVLQEKMYRGSFRSYRIDHAGDVSKRFRDYWIPVSEVFR